MVKWGKTATAAAVTALAVTSPTQVTAGSTKRNGISYIGSQRTRPDTRNPLGACATVSVYDKYNGSINRDVAKAKERCAINSSNARHVYRGDSDHYHYHPEPNGRTPIELSHYHITTSKEKAKCFATQLNKKQNFPDKSRKKFLSQIDRSCETRKNTLYVDRLGQAHKSPAQTLYIDSKGRAHKSPSKDGILFMDTKGQAHMSL